MESSLLRDWDLLGDMSTDRMRARVRIGLAVGAANPIPRVLVVGRVGVGLTVGGRKRGTKTAA